MGFSVSGATAVVFIGVLVSTATLYPAVDRYAERRSEAVDARDDRLLRQQNTALEIANATYNASTDTLTVSARNTGASTLAVSDVDTLVDGVYVASATTTTSVAGNQTTDIWAPGETLRLRVTTQPAPDRVKLVTGPGVAAATAEVT
jgi:flagellar protein FlaF